MIELRAQLPRLGPIEESEAWLALACAQVGQERRDRQWAALERLGALVAYKPIDDGETLAKSLTREEAAGVLAAMTTLGWGFEAPAGAEGAGR